MADAFDSFLAAALRPPGRAPDRAFVAHVQARIAVEERLAAQRRLVVAGLIKQLVALVAIAAAVWWAGRASPVASWLGRSPELGLVILLAGFASLVGIFSTRQAHERAWGSAS